jgi:hypothetical protein
MSRQHFVRVGAMGHVGRFTAVDAVLYPRGCRVIVRTARGLETGEILAPCNAPVDRSGGDRGSVDRGSSDGAILRGMTVEDQLLEARLEKNRDRAFRASQRRLCELQSAATLLDVELLFDGRSLFFYFLGDVTPEVEAITQELAETYDSVAQLRQFAETMSVGCGPGCGTQAAEGHGCATCATGCVVAGACTSHKRSA